jgi:diguanylate cyclase (GGDEF)-like protein
MPASKSESPATATEPLIDANPATPNEQPEEVADGSGGAKLFVIGENPTSMDRLADFLKNAGYTRSVTLGEPSRLLDTLDEISPDVILIDLGQADVNDLDPLVAIRRRSETCHTPVILLATCCSEEARMRAIELGVDGFLFKPANPRELLLRLRNALSLMSYQDHLAHFDVMTGLPNRTMFLQLLEQTLSRRAQTDRQAALLYLNLDRFKQVNEGLGHRVGDVLLRAVAERLKASLRNGDTVTHIEQKRQRGTVSHLGSDEFGILSLDLRQPDDAGIIARRILAGMTEPFKIAGRTLHVTPSIGIAICPEDGDDAASLLKHAAITMDQAKKSGGNCYEFFSSQLNRRSLERLSLENALRNAVERDELRLYYQPKVGLTSNRVVGVEALMRWIHPGRGLLGPNLFIPVAEESGMIFELGRWALHSACRQAVAWHEQGLPDLQVAVNLSSIQFRQRGLVETVDEALRESGLSPSRLILELTESSIMSDVETNIGVLQSLKALGVELSIDDFGTGFSSLSYLQRFPLDELKIDRSFIMGMSDSDRGVALVAGIIGLAEGLELRTVAEGVETKAQLRQVSEMGCEAWQGYLFSQPVPPERIPGLVFDFPPGDR